MAKVVGIDEKILKRVTCRNCASIVEYVPRDLRSMRTVTMGHEGTMTGLDCPGCSSFILVSED